MMPSTGESASLVMFGQETVSSPHSRSHRPRQHEQHNSKCATS